MVRRARSLGVPSCVLAAFWLLGIAATTHCSSSEEPPRDGGLHSSPYPACDAIIKACFAKDLGEGKVSECHGLGHNAKSDAPCVAEKDACIAACDAAVLPGVDAGDTTRDE